MAYKRVADMTSEQAERQRIRIREWHQKKYASDPERCKAELKAYRQANREKLSRWNKGLKQRINADPVKRAYWKKYHSDYQKAHPKTEAQLQKKREYNKLYAKQAPETLKLRDQRRRGGLANGGHCSRDQWLARCEYYGWCCAYCHGSLTSKSAQIEHVIPVCVGGKHWASNLVPACRACNRKKHINRWIPRPVWQLKGSQ